MKIPAEFIDSKAAGGNKHGSNSSSPNFVHKHSQRLGSLHSHKVSGAILHWIANVRVHHDMRGYVDLRSAGVLSFNETCGGNQIAWV